jgi:hypothetical protein
LKEDQKMARLTAKQTTSLRRLTKKLSALRSTLKKDERDLLDQLIIGAAVEVKGHAMREATRVDAKVTTKRGAMREASRVDAMREQAAEVKGHTMFDTRLGAMREAGRVDAMREQAAEVKGHTMFDTRLGAMREQASVASAVREAVSFNAVTGVYTVNIK